MLKKCIFDFYDFLRIKKSQFSKANLGYLDKFFGGMLESKLALNNLNFKCYIQDFFVRPLIWQKNTVGTFCPLPVIYVWPRVPSFKG